MVFFNRLKSQCEYNTSLCRPCTATHLIRLINEYSLRSFSTKNDFFYKISKNVLRIATKSGADTMPKKENSRFGNNNEIDLTRIHDYCFKDF